MQGNSVPLMRLFEKVSAKGNRYFAGRLGLASVVMMLDTRAESDGDPCWQVFVSEPRQAANDSQARPAAPTMQLVQLGAQSSRGSGESNRRRSNVGRGELNDPMPDLG